MLKKPYMLLKTYLFIKSFHNLVASAVCIEMAEPNISTSSWAIFIQRTKTITGYYNIQMFLTLFINAFHNANSQYNEQSHEVQLSLFSPPYSVSVPNPLAKTIAQKRQHGWFPTTSTEQTGTIIKTWQSLFLNGDSLLLQALITNTLMQLKIEMQLTVIS